MRTITTVKHEIRILALDSCLPRGVIGVVVRGGLYEDGIFFFPQESDPSGRDITKSIVESKYFPELRGIMVHDPVGRLDPGRIEKKTKLPIMQVLEEVPMNEAGYRLVRGWRTDLWVKTKLPAPIAEKILMITWTMGRLPEPVRVAHVLSKSIRKQLLRDKG